MFSTCLCFSLTTNVRKCTADQESEEEHDQFRDVPSTSNFTATRNTSRPSAQEESVKLNFLNKNFSCSKIAVVHVLHHNQYNADGGTNTNKVS